jgi:hypothetical protein
MTMPEFTRWNGDDVPAKPWRRGGLRWSDLVAEIEADQAAAVEAPIRPFPLAAPVGPVGAHPDYDLNEDPPIPIAARPYTPDPWGTKEPCAKCGDTVCGLDCLEFNASRLPVRGWLGRAIRRLR